MAQKNVPGSRRTYAALATSLPTVKLRLDPRGAAPHRWIETNPAAMARVAVRLTNPVIADAGTPGSSMSSGRVSPAAHRVSTPRAAGSSTSIGEPVGTYPNTSTITSVVADVATQIVRRDRKSASSVRGWPHDQPTREAAPMIEPIVSPQWLASNLDAVVVCDVGSTMTGGDPAAAHRARHIAGARFVLLDDALADPPAGDAGRHPLPSPERFAAALGALGIGNDATVIAYDDRGGAFAGRLVWMLRIIGQDAALLDGGLSAWAGPVGKGGTSHEAPVDRSPAPWPDDALADADAVATHLARGGVVVDSREAPRYRGETEPIDAVAGHVPGAVNLPFADNLENGRFRSADELTRRFAELGRDPDPIVYCGSGVTACHNAVAIEHTGRPRPRVYVGSWSGWSSDPDRPVAVGPEPG